MTADSMVPSARSWSCLEIIISVLVLAAFTVWVLVAPEQMHACALEDGVIENVSAAFYGLASAGFLLVLLKRGVIGAHHGWSRYLVTVGWVIFTFVAMGEEISWGQRVFGFETPPELREANWQDEFNFHNLGTWHLLGLNWLIMHGITFGLGVLLPVMAFLKPVRRMASTLAFPIPSTSLIPLFL